MVIKKLNELAPHVGHSLKIGWYGTPENPTSVTLECEHCGTVLLEFNSRYGSGIGLGLITDEVDPHLAEALRGIASDMFEREGELEIDSGAAISMGDDAGAYVESWVWVPFDENSTASDRWLAVFPDEDWRFEVACGDTNLGLAEWRKAKIKSMLEENA